MTIMQDMTKIMLVYIRQLKDIIYLYLITMFSFCCTGNISPRQLQTDQHHLNPIHRRIGNRKDHSKNQKTRTNNNYSQGNNHSFIKECDISAVHSTQQNHSTIFNNLNHSLVLPHAHLNSRVHHVYQLPPRVVKQNPFQPPRLKQESQKYNQLQDKYIGVLQRTNNFLEKQLDKSRASQHESKSQASRGGCAKSNLSSELYELRNRLNSIDLTNIKKFAKLNQHQDTNKDIDSSFKQHNKSLHL